MVGVRQEGTMRTNHEARSRESGFSLIEVLIAVLVVGIGFMAVASMTGTSISGNNRSSMMTVATYLAEDRLEELRNRDYADVSAVGSPEIGIDEQGNVVPNGLFTRSWVVTNDTPGTLMKTINITITWAERGVNHRLTMTTVIGG